MPLIVHDEQQFHLSHEEEEKLNQFQTITNFPEDDLPLIIKLLQNHGWQLERGLSSYFDGDWKDSMLSQEQPMIPERPPTPMPVGTPQSQYESYTSPFIAADSNLVPSLRTVKPLPANYKEKFSVVGLNTKAGDVWKMTNQNSPLIIILMFIPRLLVKLGAGIISLLWGIITFGFNSHVEETKVCKVPSTPSEKVLPVDQVLPQLVDENVLGRLQNLLVNNISFNDALKMCEDDYKFLLLIFIGDVTSVAAEGPDINSQRLLSKILANAAVLSLLEKHKDEMIIYIRSASELESWLVAKDLRIKYTPECLLVGNVLNSSGSLNGVTKPSVLSKLRLSSARRFHNSLKMAIDKFNPELVVSRAEKEELRLAREIKQLQDEAYQTSLKQDQIKEEKRKLEEEENRVKRDIDLKREKNKKLKDTLQHLLWLESCIDILNNEEALESDTKSYGTLQIRTAQGARLIKKFKSTTTLHAIYVNVGCHLYLRNHTKDSKKWAESIAEKIESLAKDDSVLCFKDREQIADEISIGQLTGLIKNESEKWNEDLSESSEISFDFELISPFPRNKVPVDKELTIKEVTQLWPNGNILVEAVIEEDDDKYDYEADEEKEESVGCRKSLAS